MRLPLVNDPQRYLGLFVIDFGAWTAVGYTGDEVAWLLARDEYADAQAYCIRRVDAEGRMEMQGVSRAELAGSAVMLFASTDSDEALADFRTLQHAARQQAPPHAVQIALLDLPGDTPHAVSLRYALHAEAGVAAWLTRIAFAGGESVTGGDEARRQAAQAVTDPIATAVLEPDAAFQPRSSERLLATIHDPTQR